MPCTAPGDIICCSTCSKKLTFRGAVWSVFRDVNVAPSKGNLYRNVDPATVPYEFGGAYSADAFFPKKVAELRTPFVYRDFRGQTVDFHPVQYNAVTGVLRVYTSVEVRVHNDFDQIGENNFTP